MDILPDSHNNYPNPVLRHAIVGCVERMILHLISHTAKIIQNHIKSGGVLPVFTFTDSIHIFGHKSRRIAVLDHPLHLQIQPSSFCRKPLSLSRKAEILAGKPPDHNVRLRQYPAVQFPNIAAIGFVAKIIGIGFTRFLNDVIGKYNLVGIFFIIPAKHFKPAAEPQIHPAAATKQGKNPQFSALWQFFNLNFLNGLSLRFWQFKP